MKANTPSIKGFIDKATTDSIIGWVSQGSDVDAPALKVALSEDGKDIASTTANLPRPGVAKKGLHPTGRCGFRFKGHARPDKVRVFAVLDDGQRIELPRSRQLQRHIELEFPAAAGAVAASRRPCVVINPACHDQPKTFVVLGVSRGGTSLVAGILRLSGVFMGHKVAHDSHEDAEFHSHDAEALKTLIQARNAEQADWGWKYPHAVEYLDEIRDSLRNPHFIVIFRDLLGVAQGFNRKHQIPIVDAIAEAHQRYAKVARFVTQCNDPLLTISYEKAITQQRPLLDDLAAFCGLDLPPATQRKCLEFIKPGDYVSLSEKQLRTQPN